MTERQSRPDYCQYSMGPCDQSFQGVHSTAGILLYPSSPEHVAFTIHSAASTLRRLRPGSNWLTWEDLRTAGQSLRLLWATWCEDFQIAWEGPEPSDDGELDSLVCATVAALFHGAPERLQLLEHSCPDPRGIGPFVVLSGQASSHVEREL